jgi:hypothetical protein
MPGEDVEGVCCRDEKGRNSFSSYASATIVVDAESRPLQFACSGRLHLSVALVHIVSKKPLPYFSGVSLS